MNTDISTDVTEYGGRRLLIVLAVMSAALMQTLDSTITNVALPTIQGNLGASQDEASWVVTAYTIAAIIVIPLTPWLQARFGRRNYYVASIVGFTLSSVACGVSGDLHILILFRVVQGAFGGGLLATAQSILRDTFPARQLGVSQGIFALGAIMGPALGPPLGGFLVDNYSWQWCFEINVAPGVFAAVVLFTLLRDPLKPRSMRVDAIGLLFLAFGLGALQYVLTEGEQNYWLEDPTIALLSVACVLSLGAFTVYELYGTKNPIVDLTVLRNGNVSAGTVLAFAVGIAILGSTYALPQFTQGELAFTPTLSGMLFVLRALPIAICTIPIVRLSNTIDPRIMVGAGFAVMAIGNAMQSNEMTLQTGFWTMASALALTGLGSAFVYIPLTIAVLGGTSHSEGPKATALTNLSLQLGGSVSVAALDVVLHRREQLYSTVLGANATLANPAVRDFLAQHSAGDLAQYVYAQAGILSYANVTLAIAALVALCTPLVFLMRKSRPLADAAPVEVG